ncbi:amidohydrolase family protein [Salinicola tamaricis]|uniref:amidohydrolase family protein n=1 Tax=Salinicola tamaricis TaxID=1771309 RepID=UPI001F5DBFB7|nr:amidohydrolase family protein [Salinicola tamaricis]
MLYGNILTPEGWRLGWLRWQAGRVTSIDGEAVDPTANDHPRLLPGFVDLHVHGGGGADAMEGGEAAATLARTHMRFGTTSLLVTTMTAPPAEIERACAMPRRGSPRPPNAPRGCSACI